MKIKRFISTVLFGLLLFGNTLFATNLDSLQELIATTESDTHEVSLLCKLAWELKHTDHEGAFANLEKAQGLAESIEFPSGKAKTHLYRGMIQTWTGEMVEADRELHLALVIYQKLRDQNGIGKAWNKLGILYFYQGDYKKAISHYEKALEHFTDQQAIAMCHNNMALSYKSLGETDRYLASLLRATKTFEKIGDLHNTCLVYGNIGSFYRSIDEYDKSIEYYQKAANLLPESSELEVQASIQMGLGLAFEAAKKPEAAISAYQASIAYAKRGGFELEEAMALNNLANFYEQKEEFEKATERYEASLAIFEKLKNTKFQAAVMNNLAEIHHKQGDLQSSIQYMHRSLELALESGDLENISTIYKNLGELYEEAGSPEKALRYQKKYVQVKDSLLDAVKLKEIIALEIEYEAQLRAAELLETKLEKEEFKAMNSKLWLGFGLFGLCLFLAATIVIWQRRAIKTLRKDHFDVAFAYAHLKGRMEGAFANGGSGAGSSSGNLPPSFETLSKREIEVFLCLANGLPNKAIAEELHISVDTVRTHAKNIYSKLNLKNRRMVMQMAHEFALI